jgi:hypothetical protein
VSSDAVIAGRSLLAVTTPESRCSRYQTHPLNWHNYTEPDGVSPIPEEIRRAADNGLLPASERKARYGAIVQRRAAAARGELDPDQVTPTDRNPALWEIRWAFAGNNLQLRQYHHEPSEAPGWLVAARFHHKTWVPGDANETRRLQDLEIDVASQRVTDGRAYMSGIGGN